MHHLRLRSAAALLTVVGAGVLAGCSGADRDSAVPEDYTLWMNQASAQLNGVTADSHGGAGGRLTVEDGSRRARARVSLDYDLAGPYDVLAVCRSSETVHLTIRDFTTDGAGADHPWSTRSAELTSPAGTCLASPSRSRWIDPVSRSMPPPRTGPGRPCSTPASSAAALGGDGR